MAAPPPAPPPAPGRHATTYRASVERWENGALVRGRLSVDREKFRVEIRFPAPPGKTPATDIELYDGGREPPLVWDYSPKHREAWPTFASSLYAPAWSARRIGEAETRRRYRIPPSARIPKRIPAEFPRPALRIATLSDYPQAVVDPAAAGSAVAGRPCRLYRATTRSGGGVTRRVRAWVDPRTGLVLKLEEHLTFPESSPMPPRRGGYTVRTLELPRSLPRSTFRLPAGTKAVVPEIFGGVRLPDGVRRAPVPGGGSGTGIGYRR